MSIGHMIGENIYFGNMQTFIFITSHLSSRQSRNDSDWSIALNFFKALFPSSRRSLYKMLVINAIFVFLFVLRVLGSRRFWRAVDVSHYVMLCT